MQENFQQQDLLRFKNGRILEYYSQPQKLSGKIVGQVLTFRDVTIEKQEQANIEHQAFHDPLTKLPNRALFDHKLSEAIAYAAEHSQMMGLSTVLK